MAQSTGKGGGFSPGEEKQVKEFVNNLKNKPVGISEFKEFSVPEHFLERWDFGTNGPSVPKTEQEILERIAVVYIFGTHCMELGRGACYDQTKWDGGLQCRTCCHIATACFSHPSLEKVWADVQSCAWQALAIAT